jgi:hypothetical protein
MTCAAITACGLAMLAPGRPKTQELTFFWPMLWLSTNWSVVVTCPL